MDIYLVPKQGTFLVASSDTTFLLNERLCLSLENKPYVKKLLSRLQEHWEARQFEIDQLEENELSFLAFLAHKGFLEPKRNQNQELAELQPLAYNLDYLKSLHLEETYTITIYTNGPLGREIYKHFSSIYPNIQEVCLNNSVYLDNLDYQVIKHTPDKKLNLRDRLPTKKFNLHLSILDFPDYQTVRGLEEAFQCHSDLNYSWLHAWFQGNTFHITPWLVKNFSFSHLDDLLIATSGFSYQERLLREVWNPDVKTDLACTYFFWRHDSFKGQIVVQNIANSIKTLDKKGLPKLTEITFDSETKSSEVKYHYVPSKELLGSSKGVFNILQNLTNPRLGIITQSAQVFKEESEELNLYFFEAAYRAPILDPNFLSKNIEFISGGSGAFIREAKLKAEMEAVERYCSMHPPGDENIIFESYNKISNIKAIKPDYFVGYSEEQYSNTDFPCIRFSPNQKIHWVRGHKLNTGEQVLLPYDYIYYPPLSNKPLYIGSSNGAAAHLSYYQAIASGLYELIERDAWMVTWYSNISPPKIELSNISHFIQHRENVLDSWGYELSFYNLTLDIPVPVVLAVGINKYKRYPMLILGLASSKDFITAGEKALQELLLQLLTIKHLPKAESIKTINDITSFLHHRDLYLHPENSQAWQFLVASDVSPVPQLNLKSEDKDDEAHTLIALLERSGIETFASDLTIPELKGNISIVKVLATELQPLGFLPYIPLGGNRLPINISAFPDLYDIYLARKKSQGLANKITLTSYPHPFA